MNAANEPTDIHKCTLNLFLLHAFGTEFVALLDRGAVPNIISNNLLNLLLIKPKTTRRTITVSSDANTECIESFQDIPVIFPEVTTHMEYLVTGEVPVNALLDLT